LTHFTGGEERNNREEDDEAEEGFQRRIWQMRNVIIIGDGNGMMMMRLV